MFKRTLLTMTALSNLILISPTLQNAAMAGNNNPMIRMTSPSVKMRIDTRRLALRKDANKAALPAVQAAALRSSKAEAGPQPEPPTRPKRTKGTNIAKQDPAPLPRSRPYNEFEENGDGSDIDVADALPPESPFPDVYEGFFDITGGNLNDLRDVAALLEDGLDNQNALPEIPGAQDEGDYAGVTGGDRLIGGKRIGGYDWRAARSNTFIGDGDSDAPGIDLTGGAPSSPASQAPSSDHASSDGGCGDIPASYGTVHNCGTNAEGETEAAGTREGNTTPDGRTENGHENWTANREGDSLTVNAVQFDENGNKTGEFTMDVQTYGDIERTVHEWRDASGNMIERRVVKRRIGNGPAGQPNPEGGGVATGLCAGWNPANGCGQPGLKIWDTTGQPGTSEDATATAGSAGASIGPEAVTNGGDGSFTAGGNTGGGGFKMDPCATVSGCGDGLGGPGGPTASMEGVRATLN